MIVTVLMPNGLAALAGIFAVLALDSVAMAIALASSLLRHPDVENLDATIDRRHRV